MKALKDFSHLGIDVKAGEEVSDDLFEADVYPMLVMKGLIADVLVEQSKEIPVPSSEDRSMVTGSRTPRSRKETKK